MLTHYTTTHLNESGEKLPEQKPKPYWKNFRTSLQQWNTKFLWTRKFSWKKDSSWWDFDKFMLDWLGWESNAKVKNVYKVIFWVAYK